MKEPSLLVPEWTEAEYKEMIQQSLALKRQWRSIVRMRALTVGLLVFSLCLFVYRIGRSDTSDYYGIYAVLAVIGLTSAVKKYGDARVDAVGHVREIDRIVGK